MLPLTVHSRAKRRTPTVLVTFDDAAAADVSVALAERDINAPSSNFYAWEASHHLGLGEDGGLRIGLAPYSTEDEIDRLLAALGEVLATSAVTPGWAGVGWGERGGCHPMRRQVPCREGWPMITVDSLTRRYAGFTAVDNVSFTAQPGRVTGFLGPNGAGKSTTMRVMVGLTAPTSGSATIDGVRFADLPNPGLEVGVLLDASAQHAGRTGREILVVAADTMGLPRKRVDEMLELVSLTPTEAKRRVRNYSLGMRQRLGIATALLGDPRVLILDEPANGLDPAGIRWMRDLLRGYANKGGTVLLSSHLLHEIEVIADDLVVIGNGKIVASGTKEELLAAAGTLARSTSPRDLAHALEQAGIPGTLAGDGSVRTDADPDLVGVVALDAGIALTELRSAEGAGLEDMFLSLTADTQREGVAA